MKKIIIFSLVLVAVLASFLRVDPSFAVSGNVAECYDLEIIFARGSGGEREKTDEFFAVKKAAEKIKKKYGLSYRLHDLDYPAVSLSDPLRLLGTFVSAGKAFSFGRSVEAGIMNGIDYSLDRLADCYEAKFIYVGYSQGAIILNAASRVIPKSHTAFIMLLGDPYTYLPEGGGLFPDACSGRNLSPWRTYVPNCRTYRGALGAKIPYTEVNRDDVVSLWCNRTDYICGSSKNPLRNSGHTTYASSGEIGWGMAALAKKHLKKKESSENPFRILNVEESDESFKLEEMVDDGDGSGIEAPFGVKIWREDDLVKLAWQDAPPEARYLLVKVNGYDLGYVDVRQGGINIGDIDTENFNISLAWMDKDGELGQDAYRSPDSFSKSAPDWYKEPVMPEDIEELPSGDNTQRIGDIEKPKTAKVITNKPNIDAGASASASLDKNDSLLSTRSLSHDLKQEAGLSMDKNSVESIASTSKLSMKTGIEQLRIPDAIKIGMGVFSAFGLLILLFIRRRRQ